MCESFRKHAPVNLTRDRQTADNAHTRQRLAASVRMHLDTQRKLHSFTGLFPLGAYLLFHAYEHVAVRDGRGAILASLGRTSSVPLEVAVVLLPLLGHALLGLRLSRRQEPSEAYASPAFRKLQAYTGIVTALFLLLHVGTVWLPRALSGRSATAYGALREQVGTLPLAALYAVGTSAACIHFAQGLSAVLIRNRLLGISAPVARGVAALVGSLLWLTFVDELAAYATGAPLL